LGGLSWLASDSTMLRISSINMLLQGVENSAIVYRDSLAQDHAGETEKYTLVLANRFNATVQFTRLVRALDVIWPAPKSISQTRDSDFSYLGA
jgi:hypothetical protein